MHTATQTHRPLKFTSCADASVAINAADMATADLATALNNTLIRCLLTLDSPSLPPCGGDKLVIKVSILP